MTKETASEIASYLTFEPRNRFESRGDDIQICETTYLNVIISNRTTFPRNIFRDPFETYTVDLIVPADTKVENGTINIDLYTDEGFGYPEFKSIEDAIIFINAFKNENH
jgi:hypothetical protein